MPSSNADPIPASGAELDRGLDDADDRDDDREQQEEDVPIRREEIRTDQVQRAPRHSGRQPGWVAELLKGGNLGGRAVLPVRDAVLDGVRDRRSQLPFEIGPLLLRDPAERLPQRSGRSARSFDRSSVQGVQ
jgi:hypothetical protein